MPKGKVGNPNLRENKKQKFATKLFSHKVNNNSFIGEDIKVYKRKLI